MAGLNDSSSGRSALIAALIAVGVLVAIAIAMFVFLPNRVADLSVTKVDLFAPHTTFDAMSGPVHVLGQAPASEDDLYVVAHIRFTDKLHLGEILHSWTGQLKLSDGTTLNATTVPPAELPRLEEIFPTLKPLVPHPIDYDDEAASGATLTGDLVLLFPNVTQSAWQSKQSATLTIYLRDQPPQTVKLQ